jgi:hypothetical protein
MDANMIITAIGSLGFPIVACCAMGYFFAKVNENYRQDIKEINQNHKAEIDNMVQAINNNTLVIQQLLDKMEKEEN